MAAQTPQVDSAFQGQFLVAMPGMPDKRFQQTLIYICSHGKQGAMGLVANRPHPSLSFDALADELSIMPALAADGSGPEQIVRQNRDGRIDVFYGGPVECHRGFVLHSNDFFLPGTSPVGPKIGLTTTLDILKEIYRGNGPSRAFIAMGYSGWGAGQLEEEIAENGWLVCPADAEVLFSAPPEDRYRLALSAIGVDPMLLSDQVGHA
jgi:putative transcriptional regulator